MVGVEEEEEVEEEVMQRDVRIARCCVFCCIWGDDAEGRGKWNL